MTPRFNRQAQQLLAASGRYNGAIDGEIGPRSRAAALGLLTEHSGELPRGWQQWSLGRQVVAAGQLILLAAGYKIVGVVDGYAGQMTMHAFQQWSSAREGREERPWREDDVPQEAGDPLPIVGNDWGAQSEVARRFGPAGGAQCTAGVVRLPFKMRIAWNTRQTISSFRCHELVASSAQRVYERVAAAYSIEDIRRHGLDLFGGCFNHRPMRGGSSLSTHAYGVAIDHDPDRNQLKWRRDKAYLAKPECEEFWRCWEAEGWTSLGRSKNYDWMHVQAPKV